MIRATGAALAVLVGLSLALGCSKKDDDWEIGADGLVPRKVDTEPEGLAHFVKIETTEGDMYAELFPDLAPGTVANFQGLCEKAYYETTETQPVYWHRVIPGFMIQGGEKPGAPEETPIDLEICDVKHARGTLSMARSNDPNSATTEFFVVHEYGMSAKGLDGQYAAFGRVILGRDVIDKICDLVNSGQGVYKPEMDGRTPPENADKQAKILSIRIAEWEDIEPLLEDAKAEFEAGGPEDVFGDPTYGKIPYWTPDQDADADHEGEDANTEGDSEDSLDEDAGIDEPLDEEGTAAGDEEEAGEATEEE